jgi:flagellar basal-body rod protein FlgB
MDLAQIPLFEALTKRMTWLSDRQSVLAENVANADTPGYVAQDLRLPDFRQILQQSTSQVALVTTEPGHISAKRTLSDMETKETERDDTNSGAHVSLEQEMLKVSKTANDYALVATLYRANLGLVKTVLGRSS